MMIIYIKRKDHKRLINLDIKISLSINKTSVIKEKALKLLKIGVRSIEDLKNKIDLGEIKVNNKIKLGLGLIIN